MDLPTLERRGQPSVSAEALTQQTSSLEMWLEIIEELWNRRAAGDRRPAPARGRAVSARRTKRSLRGEARLCNGGSHKPAALARGGSQADYSLPVEVVNRYRKAIEVLREVLIHRNRPRPVLEPRLARRSAGRGKGKGVTKPQAVCACPFIIRVSRQTMLGTIVRYESCGEHLRLV
jgi:hypothetical protein